MLRRGVGLLAVVATSALTLSSIAHAGQSADPELDWRDCGSGFECATLDVPVDYAAPNDEQLELAVTRHPASQPARRIGALFVNYGGPGDPTTESLRGGYSTLPAVIRERFDVVTFDPRGTGDSRGIDCVDDATFDRALADDPTPDDATELRGFYDGTAQSVDLVEECVEKDGAWLADVGTRNVARDLDRLRDALGESTMSFLGYSYGTVLGAVYAQEFPTHIRAMVLDSVVDLSASPLEERRRSTRGFEATLDEFLEACAAESECPFYSDGDPRTALERLRDRFEEGLTVPSQDGHVTGASEFYGAVIGGLYSRAAWQILATSLARAEGGDGTGLRALTGLITGQRDDGTYNNLQEAIGFILCADRYVKRVSFAAYRKAYESSSARSPMLGSTLASNPIGCDPRIPRAAARDTLGDVRARPRGRVLIIGLTGDPATPYKGALDLQRRLKRSRVLTVDAAQHGGFARGFACVDEYVGNYFLTVELPPKGTVCEA